LELQGFIFGVGPAILETEEIELASFTAVDVGWAFEVSVTQSSSYSVIITAD
jgi:hypothetical protein